MKIQAKILILTFKELKKMSKQEKQESKRLPGFYIALCCCVIAVGIAGYFTERATNNGAESSVSTGPSGGTGPAGDSDVAGDGAVAQDIAMLPEDANADAGAALSDPSVQIYIVPQIEAAMSDETEVIEDAEAADAPQVVYADLTDAEDAAEAAALFTSSSFALPASGEILEEFTETLSYNTVLGDWRTHNGMDIAVDAGGSVCAAADGTVSRISSDAMGEYVIIEHDGGFSTKYCALSSIEDIAEGDTVKAGDVIGIVADSKAENTTDTHVHFELYKDGKPVDPMKYTG